MSTIAKFRIMDYDGSMHNYYRFSDGYPDGMAGVFANFPLGDHDFILETYVRRLGLEVRNADYWTDFTYVLNLSDRAVSKRLYATSGIKSIQKKKDYPCFQGRMI